jgi:fibronectin-binding autotransporter adhesin
MGPAACIAALLGSPGTAAADCAAGDGNIITATTCTIPQTLTASTGTIVSGATLATNPNTTAYTTSSNNATLTNSGTITVAGPLSTGLSVAANGGRLVNNGSITASQGIGIFVGRSHDFNITNTGNISGGIAGIDFDSFSAGGTITQASGRIDGGIRPSGFGTVIRVTGGAINGDILDHTPASGSAGSSQGRGGTVNFDLGAGTFTTNGRIDVGVVNVQSGTLVLPNDVYVSGGASGPGLTNSATLQISGVRTITGSFVQTASGTLVMQVSPQGSSQLNIARLPFFGGRTATLAGTLALLYQPGTYQPRTYTLISTDTSNAIGSLHNVTGSFSNITGVVPTPGLSQTVTIDPNDVQLNLSAVSGVPGSPNEVVLPPVVVLTPVGAAVLANAGSAVVLNGQRQNGILLDRLGARLGGIADGPAAAVGASAAPLRVAQNGNIPALGAAAAALPEALAAEGAWFRGIGDFVSVSGSAAGPGFSGSSGGFLAGFDRPVSPDLYLGLAAGYLHSDLTQHASASGQVDSGRIAAYAGGRIGPNLFTGTASYAFDRISTARDVAGIGTANEGHDGHEIALAGQWSLPTPVAGASPVRPILTPKIGVQYLHLFEDGFKETGVGGFGVSSTGNDTDSLQPYVGLAAAEKFATVEGSEITPEIRLGYSREALGNKRLISLAAADGTPLIAIGARPSRNMLTAGIGLTLRTRDSIFLYANYDAAVPIGNTTDHIVSAGLRIRF